MFYCCWNWNFRLLGTKEYNSYSYHDHKKKTFPTIRLIDICLFFHKKLFSCIFCSLSKYGIYEVYFTPWVSYSNISRLFISNVLTFGSLHRKILLRCWVMRICKRSRSALLFIDFCSILIHCHSYISQFLSPNIVSKRTCDFLTSKPVKDGFLD